MRWCVVLILTTVLPLAAVTFTNAGKSGWRAVDAQGQVLAFSDRPLHDSNLTRQLLKLCRAGLELDSRETWPLPATTPTGGWLESAWHQGYPYNQLCPLDPQTGERGLVGCLALAAGQVINFHQHLGTVQLEADDAYTSGIVQIDADHAEFDFASFSELNTLLNDMQQLWLNDVSPSPQHLAALSFAAGILLETEFGSIVSTSGRQIADVLRKRFAYPSARQAPYSENTLQILKRNICQGRPGILIIPGHAVVVDGYRGDGFFHVNYGWGTDEPTGMLDAWFRLAAPERDIISEQIVFDILPDHAQPQLTAFPPSLTCAAFTVGEWSEPVFTQIENKSDVPVEIERISLPSHFEVSIDGQSWYSTIAFTIPAYSHIELGWRYRPQSLPDQRQDAFLVYDNGNRSLAIDLLGTVQPTRGLTVQGSVSGVWRQQDSPVNVIGDVQVSGRLEIGPGVQVLFRGPFKMIVKKEAQLLARGTRQDSIIFRPLTPDTPWRGLHFYATGSDDTLAFCQFSGSRDAQWGGAMLISDSSPQIEHCRIQQNAADMGGGLYLWKASPHIKNTLIAENTAELGGGVYCEFHSRPIFTNVTLADNRADRTGSAVYANIDNELSWQNSLVWQHPLPVFSSSYTDRFLFDFCNIDTTAGWIEWRRSSPKTISWSGANITEPPLWDADFALQAGSPGIDAGSPEPRFNDARDENGEVLLPALGTQRNDIGWTGGPRPGLPQATHVRDLQTPAEFALRAFPNPFNSRINLKFSLNESSDITLEIFDITGRRIKTIKKSYLSRGGHQLAWQAQEATSGCYLVRLQSGDHRIVKKIILIK